MMNLLKIAPLLLVLTGLVACVEPQQAVPNFEEDALARGAQKVAECQASECSRLDLDGTSLADFTVLNDMPHVTKLMMSRSNFDDLTQISGMSQLTELHISRTDVFDLSGLSAFPKLELLHANNMSQYPDYAPVTRLSRLKELSMDADVDKDIAFIRDMRQLESLFIMRGDIVDLSPLAGNRTIKHLTLEGYLPEDKTPLLQMRNLRLLDMGGQFLEPETVESLENRGVTVRAPEMMVVLC